MRRIGSGSAEEVRWCVETARRWYRRSGRSLPWRATRDPYHIWLAEIMLQQTQVSRVIDYYARFLARFPTVQHLARASWRSILPVWRGLGYYHRARRARETAHIVVTRHGGTFPSDTETLRGLPGVGSYTADAVASFAFGKPAIALDTNIRRVLSRVFDIAPNDAAVPAEKLAAAAPRSCALLNHALMDIGALFCSARTPDCGSCPLAARCASAHRIAVPARNVTQVRRRAGTIDVVAACIHKDGAFLIARRTKQRGGAWEFPGGKRELGESLRAALKREIREELGIEVAVRPPFHVEEIDADGRRYRIHFSRCQILRGIPRAREHAAIRWVMTAERACRDLAASNVRAAELLWKDRGRTRPVARR